MFRSVRLFRTLLVLLSFVALPYVASAGEPTQPRNDTGQSACYDMEGSPLACNAPLFPMQDGRYGRDPAGNDGALPRIGGGHGGFDFTKIANDGSELPPAAPLGPNPDDWACTRDNLTGLLWEIKTGDGGIRHYLWSYSWYNPDPDSNGGNEGFEQGAALSCNFTLACNTKAYIEYVNSIGLCGRSDWRLPGLDEFVGVVNYDNSFPDGGAMDRTYFADGGGYSGHGGGWTIDTAHEPPGGKAVWILNFDDGHAEQAPKGILLPIRVVSGETAPPPGGEPVCGKRDNPLIPASTAGAFTLNEAGTATDARTGLSWARCAVGQELVGEGSDASCEGEAQPMNWQEAMEQARMRNEEAWLGHQDWRMPNVKELQSIFERRCFGPVVDLAVFPEVGNPYWTSTTYDWHPETAWALELFGGNSSPTNKGEAWPALRLVRGGGAFDAYEGALSYSVGGGVSGMVGGDIELRLETGAGDEEILTVPGNGGFVFSYAFSTGDTYTVSVSQPPVPYQECTVANSEGTIEGDVTNIVVTCVAPDPAVIEVTPGELSFDVLEGGSASESLAITNAGGGILHWNIDTAYAKSLVAPAGVVVDCAAEPGLIVHDDGTVESAYAGNSAWPNGIMMVDKFTPPAYPGSIRSVCVAFVGSSGVDALDFEIVVFDDNGPDGGPGTELGALAASVTGLPQYPIETPTWSGFDISSLYTTIASGSVYVGVRWLPASVNNRVFLAADQSDDRPVGFAEGQYWNHGASGVWKPIEVPFTEYRSMFIRALPGDGQPLPVGCDDPHAVSWLDVAPASGNTLAGETSEVTVSVNASGLALGEYSATLCVASDDGAGNALVEVPVSLSVAEAVAELVVTPAKVDFGPVPLGTGAAGQDVTIANSGSIELGNIAPAAPAAPFSRSGGDCPAAPFALAPAQSCTITYTFAPTTLGLHNQSLAVTSDAGSASIALSGSGVPGAPAALTIVAGDAQSAVVGVAFPVPLTVEVRDAFDNPLDGIEVIFQAPASGPGALLSATTVATGVDGRAAVTAVANDEPGDYAVDAVLIASGDTVQFALTNLPGEPADRIFASGFDESGGALPAGPAWIAGYDGHDDRDDAEAIALDAQGNAYVTGWSVVEPGNNQYATVKYDNAGNQQWVATWDDPAGMWDEAYAIAVDPAGNSYVTGRSYNGGFRSVTIKYDPSGVEQWVRRAADAGVAKALALDAGGNLYVAGLRGFNGFTTIKYDPDGNELWSRDLDAAGSDPNIGSRIVVREGRGVYIAGPVYSEEFGNNAVDYLVVHYDFDGNLVWSTRYFNDAATFFDVALAVDQQGNVFMGGGSSDYRIVKFDADGDFEWAATAGGEGGAITSLATDAAGNVYSGGIIGCGSACFGVMKHDTDGNELWRRTYDPGFGGMSNQVFALAVGTDGSVYATGYNQLAPATLLTEYVTARYDADGNELWLERYPGALDGYSEGQGIALDPFGNAYVTGRSTYDPGGTGNWDFVTIKYGAGD